MSGSSSRNNPAAEPWSVASQTSRGLPPQPMVSQSSNGRSVNHGPPGSSTRWAARYTSKHALIFFASARSACSICIPTANLAALAAATEYSAARDIPPLAPTRGRRAPPRADPRASVTPNAAGW